MKNSALINKIEKLRKEKGYKSLKSLAENAGITQQTLNNIYHKDITPRDDTLQALADCLGVYKEYLTSDIQYKDFDTWLEMFSIYDFNEQQEKAISNLLSVWGYEIDTSATDDKGLISVTTPNGEQKKLVLWHLEYIINNFLAGFDNILLPAHLVPDIE